MEHMLQPVNFIIASHPIFDFNWFNLFTLVFILFFIFLCPVLYDILAAKNKLEDSDFMKNDLVKTLCKLTGIDDGSGTFEALTSLTYWTKDQISSGDFGVCAAGIIDVINC